MGSVIELHSRMSRFTVDHPEYMFEKINSINFNMDQPQENKELAPDPNTAQIDIVKIIN